MNRAYRSDHARWWQRLSDVHVAGIAAAVVAGVWIGRADVSLAVALALGWRRGWRHVGIAAGVLGLLACLLGARAWREVQPDTLGPYSGWACLATDPVERFGAVNAVFEIDGERFEAWVRGVAQRRVVARLAGECAWISGERSALRPVAASRLASRHIVGAVDLDLITDWTDGAPVARAANRVRRLFETGASVLPTRDRPLFAGLVIGDDRAQPLDMVEDFRRSGLSHLTAVSGSNVAFVLTAAGPLLRRAPPLVRWGLTVGLISWFVVLTRFEPSIVRAGAMAAIASTGHLLGRERPPGRVLALAVAVLVLVDPLLVWSVGFWLSVAATAGVALLGGRCAAWLPGPRWLATPLGVTLGAQIAVAPVSLLVFGTLPLVSVPANLLAVPAAGLVMLFGLPAALAAGTLIRLGLPAAELVATALQWPSAIGTRWVELVARVAARLEPGSTVTLVGWVGIVAALVLSARVRAARTNMELPQTDVQG